MMASTPTSTDERSARELPKFPMPRTSPLDPPPEILRLLEEAPISRVTLWNGQEPWLVTRYNDARAVLQSSDFSAEVTKPGYPKVNAALAQYTEGLLNHMDDPEHGLYRRMLAPGFMVKKMETLVPEVQSLVDELIDKAIEKGPPVDLVAELAFPLPARVTCALLGIPFDDQAFFVECAETFLGGTKSPEEVKEASAALHAYLGDLIDAKAQAPSDDVLSSMAEHVAKGAISREMLVKIAELILIAGFDTTTNMIALGLLTLSEYPDQLELLKANPDLVPGAVEELLRYLSVTHWGVHLSAMVDVEIGGQLIRAGEGVIVANNAANRDPAVFENPNTLDIRREARNHLALGQGVHQCLGAALARIELRVAYATLLRRLPDIRPAVPMSDLQFKDASAVYGLRALPVTW